MASAPTFHVVPGSTVKRVIDDNKKQVFDAVEAAYRLHGSGDTLNPDSYNRSKRQSHDLKRNGTLWGKSHSS
jgi:hypothetical protein